MTDESFKYPRLYTPNPLKDKISVSLDKDQTHYLVNVLRRKEEDYVRLFNGQNGEWLGRLKNISKKSADILIEKQLRPQPVHLQKIHAVFCPIKKHRQDFMIEKAVELGVTDFYPVLTQNTEVRKINEERITQQIFEAAEQCERLEIPKLHSIQRLEEFLGEWSAAPLFSCIERYNATPLQDIQLEKNSNYAFLIGPEGGFTKEEKKLLSQKSQAVDLGETVLRCETALIKALVLIAS